MRKPPLRQGMVNGLVSEVVDGLKAVRDNAKIIAKITEADPAKAFEAAFEIAIEGGGAEEQVRSRYEGLNCAEIAETLASKPSQPTTPAPATPASPPKVTDTEK
ncbi:hypothetical protein IAE35_10725 [Pseudomonas sp. S75]|uniref:hypothetical protein n=1 Tax=unclassified Pseudomonas TaxID=196821 RepID=UPI0019078125|nr:MULTISPECIES: hypothetical protein [unclassified Pseudomonas]MBJ9976913.1 hypothetical protein [Pseudomonas sp. S30]MBK0153812.1 hypothetical protein [Pseudomonas sp. S75]